MVSVGISGSVTPVSSSRPRFRIESNPRRTSGLQCMEREGGFGRIFDMGSLDWEQQLADRHQVMAAVKAAYLLLEHHNEALIRVAVEIVCDQEARKCLWWDDEWYSDHNKREYWRDLVRSKFKVVVDFTCPVKKSHDVSTSNIFEGSGLSCMMDTVVTLQDLDGSCDKCTDIIGHEHERERALYHQREALQELRGRFEQQQAELESLRKLVAERGPSPNVNGDRRREVEEDGHGAVISSVAKEDRPSSRSRLSRPTSQPNTRRVNVATRLYRDAMRRAERVPREEIAMPSRKESTVGRGKLVQHARNDTPKVNNTLIEEANGKASSQEDKVRKLNPIQAKQNSEASWAAPAPPVAKSLSTPRE